MTQPINADVVSQWLATSPFIRFMNLEVVGVDAQTGEISMRMPMRAEFERGAGTGQFHGGPVAAFIDTVGDFAVSVLVGGGVPTINFRVDYLRPCVGQFLDARAVVRRLGKTVGVVDIDITDDQGRLSAIGRGCYGARLG
ncbi:MAG: PaaI family thioesterase [Betaproteobacteria bacterium]|nr:PaaI family thioesterase [Betaproteobacteria bacterium]